MKLALALVLAVAACTDTPPLFGPPTESACTPGGTTLTYATFGKPFMEAYCTRCHDSKLRGEDRQGAPSYHDFDTIFGIRAVSDHIDETSASGPAATNKSMPPDKPAPTLAERQELGEWIACDMPP